MKKATARFEIALAAYLCFCACFISDLVLEGGERAFTNISMLSDCVHLLSHDHCHCLVMCPHPLGCAFGFTLWHLCGAVMMMVRDCAPRQAKVHVYGFNWPGGQWPAHKVHFTCSLSLQLALIRTLAARSDSSSPMAVSCFFRSMYSRYLAESSLNSGGCCETAAWTMQVTEEQAEIRDLERRGKLTIHTTQCKVG